MHQFGRIDRSTENISLSDFIRIKLTIKKYKFTSSINPNQKNYFDKIIESHVAISITNKTIT